MVRGAGGGCPADPVWKVFVKVVDPSTTQVLAKCHGCGQRLSINTYRLRRHAAGCEAPKASAHPFVLTKAATPPLVQSLLQNSSSENIRQVLCLVLIFIIIFI